jgi:ketosteroid isomerase-like protein
MTTKPNAFDRVVLEMSLKPFKEVTSDSIRHVCEEVVRQWRPLIDAVGRCSVLLWVAEGSEMLTWSGDLDQPIEWARYIGHLNDEILHRERSGTRLSARLYRADPPTITYRHLQLIIRTLKETFQSRCGKSLTVGAAFDLGPEFARSEFKFHRHPEITRVDLNGKPVPAISGCAVVCCWSSLKGDAHAYAAYPEGIPEGTPFGQFLGRQCGRYFPAMGFDYIWFSNGFGFTNYPWTYLGINFDGTRFLHADYRDIKDRLLSFWEDFKSGSGDIPIEVRGTNMGTGMDLATDLVPLQELYRRRLMKYPPPNSPWGALDDDFGLEMTGYMSRIAELPGEGFPFRFYINDPWYWQNPWIHLYNREPFDIFCPMSVTRINRGGKAENPSIVEFLTIDTEKGELDERCPRQVIPHILQAAEEFPDEPGILTWLYPFGDYHTVAAGHPDKIGQLFFGDWFTRNAVNQGLPLNTVISAEIFQALMAGNSRALESTILFTPAPLLEDTYEPELLRFIRQGGRVLFYGPVLTSKTAAMLNVKHGGGLEGCCTLTASLPMDRLHQPKHDPEFRHVSELSGGKLTELLDNASDPYTRVHAYAVQGAEKRLFALTRSLPEWNGGAVGWVRGSLPFESGLASHEPVSLPIRQAERYMDTSVFVRYVLAELGYAFLQEKADAATRSVLNFVSRHDNAFFFSGCKPDTTVIQQFAFPDGAPLMIGKEARVSGGFASYCFDRSFRGECRVFVKQQEAGVISCRETVPRPTARHYPERCIRVAHLQDADVTIYPPPEALRANKVEVSNRATSHSSLIDEESYLNLEGAVHGNRIILKQISGTIEITW